MFISVSFIVSLFSIIYGNRLNPFSLSDWLFLANCILPIVNLNVFIQSIPSRGVISVLSVSNTSLFVCCFRTQYPLEYPRNFTSFCWRLGTGLLRFVFRLKLLFFWPLSLLLFEIRYQKWVFSLRLSWLLLCSVYLFLRFFYSLCDGYFLYIHRMIHSILLRLDFSLFGCCWIAVCMLLRSVLFYRISYSLLLARGICVVVSSLKHRNICTVGYWFFSIVFQIVPVFVLVLLWGLVFLSLISRLLVLCSVCSFPPTYSVSLARLISSVLMSFLSLSCPVLFYRWSQSCISISVITQPRLC